MDHLLHNIVALIALTAMEIVLGIDNIVFISVVSSRLPLAEQATARKIGLLAAMGTRLLLLLTITWVMRLTTPIFPPLSNAGFFVEYLQHHTEINNISVRDLILLVGGLFLIRSSVIEIHNKIEGSHEDHAKGKVAGFWNVIVQIAILDIIFSLDSVITAVGIADHVMVMVLAILSAVAIMLLAANPLGTFIDNNPTVKMLALAFILLVGVVLILDGLEVHVPKPYIYFAMGFSVLVEWLNLLMRRKAKANYIPGAGDW